MKNKEVHCSSCKNLEDFGWGVQRCKKHLISIDHMGKYHYELCRAINRDKDCIDYKYSFKVWFWG